MNATKRYEVWIIGPETNDRKVVVATRATKTHAVYQYNEWLATHGSDHGVALRDAKTDRTIMADMRGCTIYW